MNDLLLKVKQNTNALILLCLNMIVAFYVFTVGYRRAFNPAFPPDGSNSMLLACIFELVTSGLLFFYLVMVFLPKHRISSLIFDSLLVVMQLAILLEIALLLYGIPFRQDMAFLICSLALITLIDRIFDIIVLGIATKKIKQTTVIELPGPDLNV